MSLLMKLPKSEQFFGYSDDNGVIYFIHSGTKKFITKYHKSFNNKGHITVPKSKRSKALMKEIEEEGFQYNYGVLMGNKFWTFGGYFDPFVRIPQSKFNSLILSRQTTIWSTEKQVWIKGPKLFTESNGMDTDIFLYNSMADRFSYASVINSTTIIFIGGYISGYTVICFNMAANRWTNYPDFLLDTDLNIIEMVTSTVTFEKNGKRYNVFPYK